MRLTVIFLMFLLVTTTLFGKTSCIIEKSETTLTILGENDLHIKEFQRIKILDETGYRYALYQDYYNSFRKIKSIQYTIYDAQNKRVRRLTKSDAEDVMLNSSYEIGDVRILYIDPKYRSFPFTIEVEVEITNNGFIGFPDWMPRSMHGIEVKEATLRLECLKNYRFRNLELNGITNPVKTETDKLETYTWKVENLPALEKHLTYKSFVADQPRVLLAPIKFSLDNAPGSFDSWESFGEWFIKLNDGRNTISEQTKKVLDNFKEEFKEDEQAIIRAVYKYMQGKTRYISIQLGIGGYQTIPADKVDKNGYGDCKALTNYMKSMLEYLDIPSNYILVYAGQDVPDVVADFPSNQFNHLFLAVNSGNDTLWFECTSQTSPPAFIGNFTDDRNVLWVEKNHSRILRTPYLSADKSVRRTNCSGKVEETGDVKLSMTIKQTGMFADEMNYYQNLNKDRLEKLNYSRFNYKDFTIKSFKFNVPDTLSAILNLDYELQINGLANNLGTKMAIPLNVLPPLENELAIDVLNKKSEVRRPFTLEDNVQLTLPAGYHVETQAKNISQQWDFGKIEIKMYSNKDNILFIERKAIIEKGLYQKESFDKFYEMVKKMRSLEQSKIVVTKKT